MGTVPVSLRALKRNEIVTCDVKTVKNEEFYNFTQIDGLRVQIKMVQNTFDIFKFGTFPSGTKMLNFKKKIFNVQKIIQKNSTFFINFKKLSKKDFKNNTTKISKIIQHKFQKKISNKKIQENFKKKISKRFQIN